LIAGICSGLGDYFNINPKFIRVIFIIGLFVPFFPSLLIYACIWAVVEPNPIKPFDKKSKTNVIDAQIIESKPVESTQK
jgi:phage shock protein PspC (stress-responsive transcriptional regulator)